ncbi:hypothetical protein KEM54_005081 [Ascosphaera aggregata]|nr:hypothetical protein KEM54_005081 [Ascosphaera aggregata]
MRRGSSASSRPNGGRGLRPTRDDSHVSARGNGAPSRQAANKAGNVSGDSTFSALPPVFRQMISEFNALEPPPEEPQRKRRRVGERPTPGHPMEAIDSDATSNSANQASVAEPAKTVQTLFNVDASSEHESEDDLEWEDVSIPPPPENLSLEPDRVSELRDIQITLQKYDDARKKARVARRKPATAAEKKIRLATHKMHILCLLTHVQTRNSWCNDEEVQKRLVKILPRQTIFFLKPNPLLPQYTRSTTFADGLKRAMETFVTRYTINAPGMKKPHWVENPGADPGFDGIDHMDIVTSLEDFREKVSSLEGSRDLGAQFFCAMLRGVGVEARVVCSLQVLSFSGEAKGRPSLNDFTLSGREYIVIPDEVPAEQSENEKPSHVKGRLAQPTFSKSSKQRRHTIRKLINESVYPVFWVEAFNEAMQKWVPVDPLVTRTINKPALFEPPLNDPLNTMCYVVAFEDDLSARDVTRRYTKSYCAKTRKLRVESTAGGNQWWDKVMRFFERPFLEDRDQLEIAELTARAAAEPMPRNIQDFKDHPVYALERHLRLNEVIYPRREIGKVAAGKLSAGRPMPASEPVFRRNDVHVCKSADGWYRLGRTLKVGEQPLKRVKPKTPTSAQARKALAGTEEVVIPMYAEFQTEVYTPPPLVNNKVPKNSYGNIDVYVPSMVPAGGFHLKHPEAARAARLLGIDYADAVTGFTFKGRSGTAVTYGIVASLEYKEALETILRGFAQERITERNEQKRQLALNTWKEMLLRLRIRERVRSYFSEAELGEGKEGRDEKIDETEEFTREAGGFLPDEGGGGFLAESQTKEEEDRTIAEGNDSTLDYSMPGRLISKSNIHSQIDYGRVINPASTEIDRHQEPNLPTPINEKYGLGLLDVRPPTTTGLDSPPAQSVRTTPRKMRGTPRYNLVVTPTRGTRTHSGPPDLSPETVGTVSPASSSFDQTGSFTCTDNRVQRRGSVTEPIVLKSSDSSQAGKGTQTGDVAYDSDNEDFYDQQSMMSHDSEDEDAEPEWLLF